MSGVNKVTGLSIATAGIAIDTEMTYEFIDNQVVDELSFETCLVAEKYPEGLSIDSYALTKFVETGIKYQSNEVMIFMPHNKATELRDALITMYPMRIDYATD